jgi:RiboL-PSP-HEPN
MKTVELARQAASLKQLIKRVGHDPSTRALEMQAHWARYLCVLTSGFVENIVRNLYGAYAEKNSYSAAVVRYAKRQLDSIQNPRPARLVEMAAAFDPTWGRDLEAYLALEYRSDAINAIMSNRHLIAHGRNSNITVGQVSLYLSKIVEVAEYIEEQCQL